MSLVELWRRGQAGWPRRFPLVQFPNPPLLVALAAGAITALTGVERTLHRRGRSLLVAGLGVWAWQELADGANWFRRVLGAAGLARVIAMAARERGSTGAAAKVALGATFAAARRRR
jgi:hypothetical protein